MSRVRTRLEQYKAEIEKKSQYKHGLPGSALDIVNTLLNDLEQDEKENGWIPVCERLPDKCKDVIATTKYDGDAEYEVYESFLSSVSYYASGEQFRIYAKVTNSFIAAYFRECDFGKSIFFTREDAEKKLEELKNEI